MTQQRLFKNIYPPKSRPTVWRKKQLIQGPLLSFSRAFNRISRSSLAPSGWGIYYIIFSEIKFVLPNYALFVILVSNGTYLCCMAMLRIIHLSIFCIRHPLHTKGELFILLSYCDAAPLTDSYGSLADNWERWLCSDWMFWKKFETRCERPPWHEKLNNLHDGSKY